MSDETKISIANTHVPDKLYGYGLQVRQMLFELLNCEINSVVSVEKFDDIGIENGKEKTAIQTKSALSNRNPVSDRAIDLWKTLYNWLLALKENELPIGFTLFTLVINVNKSGNIVTWLNQARNEKEAEVEYKKIRGEFIGKNGEYIKQNDSINNYIMTFLAEENKKYALDIIEKFKLVVIGEGHTNKIYDEFRAKTYLPSDIQQLVFDKMLGWIDKTTALQIESGQVMQIAKERFNKELTLTQTLVNQNKALVELAPGPTKAEIELQQNECKTYIRQLQIINLDYDAQLVAISSFIVIGNTINNSSSGTASFFSEKYPNIKFHKRYAPNIGFRTLSYSSNIFIIFFQFLLIIWMPSNLLLICQFMITAILKAPWNHHYSHIYIFILALII